MNWKSSLRIQKKTQYLKEKLNFPEPRIQQKLMSSSLETTKNIGQKQQLFGKRSNQQMISWLSPGSRSLHRGGGATNGDAQCEATRFAVIIVAYRFVSTPSILIVICLVWG